MGENDIQMEQTGNRIGDEGAKMISEGLKSNSALTTLVMSCDEKKKKKKTLDGN